MTHQCLCLRSMGIIQKVPAILCMSATSKSMLASMHGGRTIVLPLLYNMFCQAQEVSYYPNVVICIIRHFGLKCRTIEFFKENHIFQCKISFCIHNEDT